MEVLKNKSNRGFIYGVALTAALGVLATAAAAQQAPPPLKVANIKDNIYWTQGGAGGNAGIIVGNKGVIVVDTKTTVDSSKDVQAEIAKLTPKPVTTAIVTHSDGDHVNGLAGFPDGLTIIAQTNCKAEMVASAGKRGAAPQDRLPTKTIDKKENMTIDGVKVELIHVAPAHTSGDLIVYFPAQKVVFAGDLLVTNQKYTLIHEEKNCSVTGWIQNAKAMIALNADTYVTGHGDLMTKADVQNKLDLIQANWDKVKAMVAQGKSLDDVKTALGESTEPAKPGPNGNLPFATLTEVMYRQASGNANKG